jgi:biotin carboxyl carrier protein
MSGYAAVISRIAQLDSLIKRVDPSWTTMASGSLRAPAFSSVLESVYNPSASASSTAASSVSALDMSSPLPGSELTQAFGPTSVAQEPSAVVDGVSYAHYHQGIDLAAPLGTPVLAAASGTVTSAGRDSTGAVVVRIRHDDGYETLYGHLDSNLQVTVGQQVKAGQTVGVVGLTGNTTGPHLHFGLYQQDGTAIDPAPWLASGRLPDPATLAAPSSAADPATLSWESSASALATFDSVAAQIPYASQIRAAAVAKGVDPLLLASLTSAESSFRPTAVSSVGAQGLTQLMPGTARSLGVTDPFDPQQNLDGGASYLATQLKRFGRVDLALAAYNDGPGAIAQAGAVPPSTSGYVSRILGTWSHYQEQAQ